MEDVLGREVALSEEYFRPYTKRRLLIDLLSNLKKMHVRRHDYQGAIAAADRVTLLDPYQGGNLKERAWMFKRTLQYGRAIDDLEAYLDLYPTAPDAGAVRGQIRSLWGALASLN